MARPPAYQGAPGFSRTSGMSDASDRAKGTAPGASIEAQLMARGISKDMLDRVNKNRNSIWRWTPTQRQTYLKAYGFSVPESGKSGPRTAAATWTFTKMANKHIEDVADYFNARDQKYSDRVWDLHFKNKNDGTPDQPDAPTRTTKYKPPVTNGAAGGPSEVDNIVGSALDAGNLFAGEIPNPPKYGFLNPTKWGNTVAGLGFNSPIADLANAKKQMPAQLKGRLSDLNNWYGSAISAQTKAGEANLEATGEAQGNITEAIKNIVSSAGGNEGAAALTAAEGASATKLLQSQGASQTALDNDLKSLMSNELAGRKNEQTNLNAQNTLQLTQELAKLRGEKGLSNVKARMEAKQYNNDLRTQLANFGLQRTSAIIAAQAAGVDLATGIQNLKKASQAAEKPKGWLPWDKLTAGPGGQQDQVMKDVAGSFFSQGADAEGNPTLIASNKDITSKKQLNKAIANGLNAPKHRYIARPAVVAAIAKKVRQINPSWYDQLK